MSVSHEHWSQALNKKGGKGKKVGTVIDVVTKYTATPQSIYLPISLLIHVSFSFPQEFESVLESIYVV